MLSGNYADELIRLQLILGRLWKTKLMKRPYWFYDDIWKESEIWHADLKEISKLVPKNDAPEITISYPDTLTQNETINHHIKPQIVNEYMQPEFRDELIKEPKQDMLNLLALAPTLVEEVDSATH
jgi:hypothetical protein